MARRSRKKQLLGAPIYLFVEGEKTEPVYFDILKRHLNMTNIKIHSSKGKSGRALLDSAISQIKLGKFDHDGQKYLIFDKDALTKEQLLDVFHRAARENFNIGFSNLNFEVWLLAHFEKLTRRPTALSDKKWLHDKLTEKLKQPYKKGDRKQLEIMVPYYEQAIAHAKNSHEASFDYQCSTVGTIIEKISNRH